MSERIYHAAEAVRFLAIETEPQEYRLGWETADAQHAATIAVAQVHATLALVEQQRIANLIALAGYEHANGSRSYQYAVARPVNEFDLALNEEIKEALGL